RVRRVRWPDQSRISRKWALPAWRRKTSRPATRTRGGFASSRGMSRRACKGRKSSKRPPQGSRPSASMRRSFSVRLVSKFSGGADTVVTLLLEEWSEEGGSTVELDSSRSAGRVNCRERRGNGGRGQGREKGQGG